MGQILKSRVFILIEFIALFICVPGYIIFSKSAPFMAAFLWGGTLYAYLILRYIYHDHFADIWKWRAVTWKNLKPILIRWSIACVAMSVFICFYDPDKIFMLFKDRPKVLIMVLIFYPVLSALPQEFIFCSYFFERYEVLFKTIWNRVIVSAVLFAYAHILYINPVAPVLSLFGGFIFALTYAKTKSLALVTVEHALYGNFLFVIGLGWYFYSGAVAIQ